MNLTELSQLDTTYIEYQAGLAYNRTSITWLFMRCMENSRYPKYLDPDVLDYDQINSGQLTLSDVSDIFEINKVLGDPNNAIVPSNLILTATILPVYVENHIWCFYKPTTLNSVEVKIICNQPGTETELPDTMAQIIVSFCRDSLSLIELHPTLPDIRNIFNQNDWNVTYNKLDRNLLVAYPDHLEHQLFQHSRSQYFCRAYPKLFPLQYANGSKVC